MSGQEACFLTLAEQARLIRGKQLSPVEAVESALRQIRRIDGRVNGYITVMGEAALSTAREAEREIAGGGYRGPLHGVPIALKDLFHVQGVRTTAGSRILANFVPQEDAAVVARLKEAGAVIIGKTNLHEFAYGTINTNPHYGDVHNPWDLDRISGGSSGGSAAAVATGMCAAALGSDTGGSIRIPASLCGVFGIKPTYGRVSRRGVLPCAWSLDHVGPLARTAEDAALVLGAIAGPDPGDPTSSRVSVPDYAAGLSGGVSGLRAAVLREYATDPMEPEVLSGFQAALGLLLELGVKVEETSVPEVVPALGASTAILSSEVSCYHEELLRTRADDYGADVRARLELGLLFSAVDYVQAQRVRGLLVERFRDLLRQHDLLLCPTTTVTAPRLDQQTVQLDVRSEPTGTAVIRHTRLFNLTGLPAASVPCGFSALGLPMGLQMVAGPFQEATLFRLAHAYQQATGWHHRIPAVAVQG